LNFLLEFGNPSLRSISFGDSSLVDRNVFIRPRLHRIAVLNLLLVVVHELTVIGLAQHAILNQFLGSSILLQQFSLGLTKSGIDLVEFHAQCFEFCG
jgi:hypothetical protein